MSNLTEKKIELPIIYHPEIIGGFVWEHVARQAIEALESERDAARVACALSCTLHACDSAECAAHVLIEDGRHIVEEKDALKATRIAYASEFPPDKDGDPDVGNIHANIRALKARVEELEKRYFDYGNEVVRRYKFFSDKIQQAESDLAREKERSAAALTRIEELTEQVEKMPERIDLLARYFECSGWSMWASEDPEVNAIRVEAKKAYEKHRDRDFTLARLEGHRAAIKAALLPSPPSEGDQG